MANGRKNANSLMSVVLDTWTAVPTNDMPEFLPRHFLEIMGHRVPHLRPFDLSGKIGPCLADKLRCLDDPITEEETLRAINDMPRGKASRLDGLPIEFYQVFWQFIKQDIMAFIK